MTVILIATSTACGKTTQDNQEIPIDFSNLISTDTEESTSPIIIRDDTEETIIEDEEDKTEEESTQLPTVTPYADRISGDYPVTYDITSATYENGVAQITYPQLTNMDNADLQSTINDKIYQTALSGSDDTDLAAYSLTYEIATKGTGILSIIYRGYENYAQSAYPSNIIKTININLLSGATLTLKDYANVGDIVTSLENATGYTILNDGVDKSDFDLFLNNGYMTDYAMLLLDYDTNTSGYSAIRDNHLVLFIEAEHAMGDYVELEFEKDL
jgi:hypothetical protein